MEDVKDGAKGLQGSKSLSELPQNVQDAYRGYDGVVGKEIIEGSHQKQQQAKNLKMTTYFFQNLILLVIRFLIKNMMSITILKGEQVVTVKDL